VRTSEKSTPHKGSIFPISLEPLLLLRRRRIRRRMRRRRRRRKPLVTGRQVHAYIQNER